ncbi:MAG: radical SAM protein [Candidatus Omnitrophica bacterium]|nr:radical SAM protein [Candidatus Omnitrophota bacterium]
MINFSALLGGRPQISTALKLVSRIKRASANSPLVVFNLTRRCNLKCIHCYSNAEDKDYKNELSLAQVKAVIDSFKKLKVPIILFSGGEPLVRKDILDIIAYAKKKGIRSGLSTNGTLISEKIAAGLKQAGLDYAGISIDADKNIHERFRASKGSFDQAIKGIRNVSKAGIKTGIRFTLTRLNAEKLAAVLDICIREKISRFCMYHLVYSGRGEFLPKDDVKNAERRKIIDFLIKKTLKLNTQGNPLEILTVDNHADGIYIYNYLKKNNPQLAKQALKLLKFHGGCSAGVKIVDVSQTGDIHACQFWQEQVLANIKETEFCSFWNDKENKQLNRLRHKHKYLKGKCSRCAYKEYCGGCRVRAFAKYNDFWQEDPCCYLTESEIK